MTSSPVPSDVAAHTPWRRWSLALTGFSAVSAIGGGAALVLARTGSPSLPPIAVLEHTPFRTFLVPGLLLALVIGGTSLSACVLVRRRSPFAVDATLLAGGSLSVWIAAEVAMMRGLYWLHALYGALGLALLGLGLIAARRSGEPRHRWVVRVTLAEALGYAAPVCAGLWSASTQRDGLGPFAALTVAGAVEGACLGLGQALAWPLPLDRRRYALLTAFAAALVWASFMALSLLGGAGAPSAGALGLGALAVLVGLTAIGFAQWLELNRHVAGAHRWIPWTALAWLLALPWSFAAGPFVDERTPLAVHLTLWGTAGLVMAYVMAIVTWQGARRLLADAATPPATRQQRGRPTSPELARMVRRVPATANDNAPELFQREGRDPWNPA